MAFTDLVRTAPLQPFSTSIIVPRRWRPSLLTLQVGGTAVALAFLGLGIVLGFADTHHAARPFAGISGTSYSAEHSVRPAYLDSADYERRLVAQAREWHRRWHSGRAVAL